MKKRFIAPTAIALAVAAGVGGGAVPGIASSRLGLGRHPNCLADDRRHRPSRLQRRQRRLRKGVPRLDGERRDPAVERHLRQDNHLSGQLMPPDVMELGNTDVASFAASGGLDNLPPMKASSRTARIG